MATTELTRPETGALDYHSLNAMLNLYDAEGRIQFDKDRLAARHYFLQHVNQNTVFFHNLEEKLRYLVEEGYYDAAGAGAVRIPVYQAAVPAGLRQKFRFETFLGAFKYYTSYTLKTFDGKRYLERYEDRGMHGGAAACGGRHRAGAGSGGGDDFRPLPAGHPNLPQLRQTPARRAGLLLPAAYRRQYGIDRAGGELRAAAVETRRRRGLPTEQYSRGGRANQAHREPVLGRHSDRENARRRFFLRQPARRAPGAGAVYLNAHHPDILRFLDTKRENADEKIRIKTLSLGVVIPDITFELAKNNEEMYLFSPYDVERVYGVPFSEIAVSEKYREMVDDKRIRKSRINAREFFQVLAEIQFESGYPYVMFEDTVNRENPIAGRINMSNLCSEILQVNRASTYHEDLSYDRIGKDISCNLGSLNIAKTMDAPDFGKAIEIAIRALTAVADMSDIRSVPSIAEGNRSARAIGLGQMNLHGYLARERIFYGSEEGIDFTNLYFYTVAYHAIRASNRLAIERGGAFDGFEHSRYASGEYFDKYTERDWLPQTERVRELFAAAGIAIPGRDDWRALRQSVMLHGLYNQNLQAVPPTGSISYINNATSSIHPIVSRIEIRKEGKIGRVYYPAPYMTNDNLAYYQDAYEIGPEKIIDTYAAATQHVDQGCR